MNTIGKNVKRLRLCKGDTQEKLAAFLHVSCQAVSKWENDLAVPDIALLPLIADYFDITIDELMDHKLTAYTSRERFVRLLHNCGALTFADGDYQLNTEVLATNAQLVKIGECFADFLYENKLVYDGIVGLAYHGIGFSSAAAFALYQKYGVTTSYCYDRKVPDSRSRWICGYTPQRGDRVIVIDDVIGSGRTLDERLGFLTREFGVEIAAVVAIVNRKTMRTDAMCGGDYISQTYKTDVYTLLADEDIRSVYAKADLT